ncbi:MAG: hypothetical protein M9916_00890 [Crocinitomicaceae bacterium]|nr:hypothetical protein [Crocinitomicaceae bacterium]
MNLSKKTKLILWIIIIWGMIISLISCAPIKRLERLQKRHPQLFNRKNDTIRLSDTVRLFIPEVHTDTVVHINTLSDTLYIDKERLHIKIIKQQDSIYVYGKCDTVYKEIIRTIEVPYTKYEVQPPKKAKLQQLFESLILLCIPFVLIYVGYQLLKTHKNKENQP